MYKNGRQKRLSIKHDPCLPLTTSRIPQTQKSSHMDRLSSDYAAEGRRYADDRNCRHSSLHFFSFFFSLRVSGFALGPPQRVPPGQNEDEMNSDRAGESLEERRGMRSVGGENFVGECLQTGRVM